jgi:D-inositol-3-phosphate glycosyltransferase
VQPPPSRLRTIVRAIPGARPLRRALLDYWAKRRAARDRVPPRGAFDRPDTLTINRTIVAFDGWALVGTRTVASVDVVLNEQTTVRANLGNARPDVGASLREPRVALACGWAATIDLTPWPLGDLRVKVIATSHSGMSTPIGHRLYTLIGEGFEGNLDEPSEDAAIHGDLVIVRGWATLGARPASRIDVHLNGRPVGLARLRVVRADVDRYGAGRLGPVTGFEYRGVVSADDTDRLEVAITVHALEGTTLAVPARHVRIVRASDGADDPRVPALRARTEAALAGLPLVPKATASDSAPRLLVFTHSLALGGGQLYLSELLRQLVPTVAHCMVVSPADGVLRRDFEAQGIEVRIIDDPQPRDIQTYEDHVRDQAMFIRGSGCDVVLLNTLGPWSAGDACDRAGVPYLWAIHESFELSDWIALNFGVNALPAYIRQQMETALGAAHKLIFEAQATSEMFARFAGTTRRTVVAYGVDTGRIAAYASTFDRSAARRQHDIPGEATVLLAMGIFEERKSQACIVEAFAMVAEVHPSARLVLVGDHPCEYSDAIHRIVAESACADRISLIPITPDIWEWYALSDLLVSASDIESLPRSMLECMAFGIPVLSTDVFGVPELVHDGVNGWLFGARDIGALVASLHRVLSLSPDERHAAGLAGRDAVKRRHDASVYGEAYRTWLADAIASPVQHSG